MTNGLLNAVFCNFDVQIQMKTMKITNKVHYINYFIIPSPLYMFRAMFSPITRST